MTFVDRMFLNWVSGTAMAASFTASMVWFTILCLPLGICSYANTFVAQYFGARQWDRIGVVMWQAVWVALLMSPLMLAVIPLAGPLFRLAGHTSESLALELVYFQILCVGAPAMLIAQSAASFYSGRGKTWVVMWTDSAFAALNVVLDYLWIFGHGGFPAWGIAGAAWATVISLWLKAVTYLILPLRKAHREEFATLAGARWDRKLVARLFQFGGPCGLQMLLDVLGFTIFIMLLGRLGSVEMEATTMAFSISTMAFMPIWGVGMAVSILVGQHLGENRDTLAARATYTGLWVAWVYMAVISLLYLVAPGLFIHGFTAGAEMATADPSVEQLAVILLRFVAAYNLLDATFMIFVSAIKGAGDTAFVLRVSLVLAVLLASLSWLSVEVLNLGVFGCWVLITLWVWVAAILFFWRFRGGKWRHMRVIDTSPTNAMQCDPEAAG